MASASSSSSSSSSSGGTKSTSTTATFLSPILAGRWPDQNQVDNWVAEHRTVVTAGTASLVSTVASFPFDSLKSRLQVKYYPSIWACGRAVLEEEGIAGFFRGVTIPLITITFVRTSSFSIYYNTKSALHSNGYFADTNKLSNIALSGAAGGITSGLVISCGSAPFELVKVQRQLEYLIAVQKGLVGPNARAKQQQQIHHSSSTRSAPYSTTSSAQSPSTTTSTRYVPQSGFAAAREIMTNHGGIRGFYIGFRLHFLRDTSGTAIYFGLYDTLRELVRRHTTGTGTGTGTGAHHSSSSSPPPPPPRILGIPTPPMPVLQFLTGSTAGILSWLAVYWIDFLKTNVQQRRLAGADSKLTAWQVLNEGEDRGVLRRIARLYRGIGISAVRSFISHGLTWTLIEQISERIDARERLRHGSSAAAAATSSKAPIPSLLSLRDTASSDQAQDASSSAPQPKSSLFRWR
ncbi:hypothetical protein OC861_006345 [Tilletia horrida]|nr:hypothetical protein OC861_006345 [Tilletia horrida]